MTTTTINGIKVPIEKLQQFQTATRRALSNGKLITDPNTKLDHPDHCFKMVQHDQHPPVYIYNSDTDDPTLFEEYDTSQDRPALTHYVLTSKLLYRLCRRILHQIAPEPNHHSEATEASTQQLLLDLELLDTDFQLLDENPSIFDTIS